MIALIIMGIYTLGIIYTIHKYEYVVKQYKDSINDYKRALNYAKNSPLFDKLQEDNEALKVQVKVLKEQLAGDESKIQYESSTYKNNTYTSMTDNKLDLFETMENFE